MRIDAHPMRIGRCIRMANPTGNSPQQTPAESKLSQPENKRQDSELEYKEKQNALQKRPKFQIPPHKPDKNSLSQHYLPLEINHKI